MSDKKVSAVAKRDFKDAGTGEKFEKGPITVSEGAFKNYEAAGLVEKASAATKASASA